MPMVLRRGAKLSCTIRTSALYGRRSSSALTTISFTSSLPGRQKNLAPCTKRFALNARHLWLTALRHSFDPRSILVCSLFIAPSLAIMKTADEKDRKINHLDLWLQLFLFVRGAVSHLNPFE